MHTTLSTFKQLKLQVGTIISAELNPKARKPAYILTIDFGHFGIKKSSAQLTQHYSAEQLMGRQIIAITNLPPMQIAQIKSEVLVLASADSKQGTILLQPEQTVPNGAEIA